MKKLIERIKTLKRNENHSLLHTLHTKHHLSRQTLLYIKEYGSESHTIKTIFKESLKILLFASLISSFGGFALEHIKLTFISLFPLIILLPTLNDMVGDYGTIVSSRFSAMLHEGRINKNPTKNPEVKHLYKQIILISFLLVLFSAGMALFVSTYSGYAVTTLTIIKIILIAVIDVFIMINVLFLISINAGLYFHRRNEDPNNVLIPITTAIADFGNMIVLFFLVTLFF